MYRYLYVLYFDRYLYRRKPIGSHSLNEHVLRPFTVVVVSVFLWNFLFFNNYFIPNTLEPFYACPLPYVVVWPSRERERFHSRCSKDSCVRAIYLQTKYNANRSYSVSRKNLSPENPEKNTLRFSTTTRRRSAFLRQMTRPEWRSTGLFESPELWRPAVSGRRSLTVPSDFRSNLRTFFSTFFRVRKTRPLRSSRLDSPTTTITPHVCPSVRCCA